MSETVAADHGTNRGPNHGPNHGPLAGIRVVELSHILSAPTCGLMLADLGPR